MEPAGPSYGMTARELGNVRVRSGSRERHIGYFRQKWAWLIHERGVFKRRLRLLAGRSTIDKDGGQN